MNEKRKTPMKINSYFLMLFCSISLYHPVFSMERLVVGGYDEVFKSSGLRTEFENNKFFLIAAVVKKDTAEVKKILKSRSPKVAMALANMLHQNSQYRAFSDDEFRTSPAPSMRPLGHTIKPFFETLTDDQKEDLDCATPVALSTFLGDKATMETLLAYGANINGHYGGLKGYAPLHVAVKQRPEMIPFLISKGALVDGRTDGDHTPLMVACQKDGKIEAIPLLLAARASLAAKTHRECPFWLGPGVIHSLTALHIAGNNNQREKVQLLLEAGAPVNEPDLQGRTPLHWAMACMHYPIAEMFLDRGADISAKSADGKTVIEHMPCEYGGHYDAVELLRNGAPYPASPQHRELVARGLGYTHPMYVHRFLPRFVRTLIYGDAQQTDRLLAGVSGNQLNETDTYKMTALLWAVCRNNKRAVERILSWQQKSPLQSFLLATPLVSGYMLAPINLSHRDHANRTALDWARKLKRQEIVSLLQK